MILACSTQRDQQSRPLFTTFDRSIELRYGSDMVTVRKKSMSNIHAMIAINCDRVSEARSSLCNPCNLVLHYRSIVYPFICLYT